MPSASTPAERPPTLLESALRREQISAVVLLAIVPVFCWIWIVAMARDMYGPMTGAGAWMMTLHWDVPHLLLLWAMWTVMMTGMMLPSASPLILLYGAAARRSAQRTATRQTYALAAGYLLAWTAFSLGATVLQRVLASLLLVSPMMEPVNSEIAHNARPNPYGARNVAQIPSSRLSSRAGFRHGVALRVSDAGRGTPPPHRGPTLRSRGGSVAERHRAIG
jgi:Predicted metal-binding integral membrane protein (DUF2182)